MPSRTNPGSRGASPRHRVAANSRLINDRNSSVLLIILIGVAVYVGVQLSGIWTGCCAF